MEKRALKSVHLTNYYHKNSGGISVAYNQLLKAAERHGRHVSLIVPGESDGDEVVGDFGKIYYVKAAYSPLFDKRYRLIMPWNSYIFDGSRIRNILEAERPDLIEIGEKYTLSLLAGMIKKGFLSSLGRPMLVHLSCERMDDNIRAFITGGWVSRMLSRKVIGDYIFPMFDYHIANSAYTAQEITDAAMIESKKGGILHGISRRLFGSSQTPPGEKVFVNQCGVENGLFSPERNSRTARQQIAREFGFSEDATVLLYAGRLSPEKNVTLLADVLKSLLGSRNLDSQGHDYQLLILGAGPSASSLRERLEKIAPGHFHMAGHISDREKLADIYANADVFVHPNPREPFGIAPLEAMASGLPVVGPKSGGILSYANDDNAWLKEPDAEDFFAAIRDVFNDDDRRERKIKNAIETAGDYSWEKSTDRLFALYDSLYTGFENLKPISKAAALVSEPAVVTDD